MRTHSALVPGLSALLSIAILAGCGDDDGGTPPDAAVPDAAVPDANQPPDASEPPPDAGLPTLDKETVVLSTGITMAYFEDGNPDGEAVILMHGYTDTLLTYYPTIQELVADDTLHVYGLELRGHGASSMPADSNCPAAPEQCFEMTDMAEDVLAFMDAKGIATAHIVGHSMSTLVSFELALAHPDRVASLMLIGPFVSGVDNAVIDNFLIPLIEGTWREALETARPGFEYPQDAYQLQPVDADPDALEWAGTSWTRDPIPAPELMAAITMSSIATRLGTWIGGVRNFDVYDVRERLQALTVRTLVIWATQDDNFPEPEQVRVRAALDAAVDACNLDYYLYKIYGKEPLPPSGFQENELGHSPQRSAGRTMADDITAWVTTGEPTRDLPYSDPENPKNILVDEDAAEILEKRKAETCPAE